MTAIKKCTSCGDEQGLNSPAGPVLASDQTGLREVVHASPRPSDQRAFLESGWSGLGRVRPYVSLSVLAHLGW